MAQSVPGKTGNLNIFNDGEDDDKKKSNGPDTEPSVSEDKVKEACFEGDEARIIQHFFDNDLININFHGLVSREPPTDGPPKRLIIKYKVKKAECVETLVDHLKAKIRDLAEKEIHIPTDQKSNLAEFDRENKGNPDILVISDIAGNKVKIVGLTQEKVDTAAHKLKIKIGVITATSGRLKRQVSDSDGSRTYASTVANGKRSYPNIDEYKKKNPFSDNSSMGNSSRSAGSSAWRDPSSYQESSSEKFDFEITLTGGLVLKVYKASITRLSVDAIVNAANDTMMHGGGVARVISDAAGYDLDKESRNYVERYGQVKVSENIVTVAGKLPYKGVIHAVGPIWHDYGNKTECLQDLYDCVFKILTRCEQRQFRTVGMSAISSGIFAVPKELCADMYIKAAVDFSKKLGAGEYAYPEELHIIDVDESILHLVKASVEKWKRNPSSIELDVTLQKYLKDNPHVITYPSSSYNSGYRQRRCRNRGHGAGQGGENQSHGKRNESSDDGTKEDSNFSLECTLKKTKEEKFDWGGVAQVYEFEGQITVKIFKGEIAKANKMDAIICGTDKSLQTRGYIIDALKKAGGYKFKNSLQRMFDENKSSANTLDVYKCEAGDLGVRYIIFILMERVLYASGEEISKYKMAVKNILEKAREWKLTQLVIPMFGTGNIQTNKKHLRKCCVALLKGIDSFLEDRGNKARVTDIHLVNNSLEVCEMLEEVFDTGAGVVKGATGGSIGGSREFSSGDDDGRTGKEINQSKRKSSSRTYNADGLEKDSDVHGEIGTSGLNPKSDFSRSRDNRKKNKERSGDPRNSSDYKGGQTVNSGQNTGGGRDSSPQGATAQGSDEKSDHGNTKPALGNLNIIEG